MSIRTYRHPVTGQLQVMRNFPAQPIAVSAIQVPFWPDGAGPSITGTFEVGQTLTLHDGTPAGSPAPTVSRRVLLNGEPIPGATSSTFVLLEEHADKTITAEFTASNGRTTRVVVSGGVVVNPSPVSWFTLNPAHISMTEVTDVTQLGRRTYTFSASVSIPADFELYLSDPAGTPGGILNMSVLVGNSGTSFPVTINRNNSIAEGETIYFNPYLRHVPTDTLRRALPTSGTLATGQTITQVDGDDRGQVVYVITRGEAEPVDPIGNIGTLTSDAKSDALALPNARHLITSPSANFFDWGNPIMPLALAAFIGDTSVDSNLLTRIRFIINTPGNTPSADGRVQLGYDNQTNAGLAIALKVPRIKSALTATEINRMETLILACATAGGNICSSTHVKDGNNERTMRGNVGKWVTPNPNIAITSPVAVLIAIAYFGAPYVANHFNNYDHVAFRSLLNSLNLGNAYYCFNFQTLGITEGSSSSAKAPTPAMMHTGLRGGWTYIRPSVVDGLKAGVDNWKGILLGDRCLPHLISGTVYSGYDEGRGTVVRPANTYSGRGKAMSSLGGGNSAVDNTGITDWLGQANSCFMEMTGGAVDAEGQRSSASYARWGMQQMLSLFALMAVTNTWDPNDITLATWIGRWNVAMKVYDALLTRGYKSWAHNGGGNSFDFGYTVVRTGSYGASGDGDRMRFTFGLRWSMSVWRDVLVPYYGLPAWS